MVESLPSKQVVAGSSPVSRSTGVSDYLPGLGSQSYGEPDGDNLPRQEIKQIRADRNEK